MAINKSLKKTFFFVSVLVVLILFFFGAWLASSLKAKKYSVVYLSDDEIYLGHLYTFPRMYLTDAYMLETTPGVGEDGKPTTVQKLVSLTNPKKVWASDRLYLNRAQVLFHGYLIEGTEADKAIKASQSEAGAI